MTDAQRYWSRDRGPWDNEIEVTIAEDGITVSVSEDIAINSYNVKQTCQYTLTREDAADLQRWLRQALA